MKKTILVILVVIWMGVIFMFSNQKAEESGKNSKSIIRVTIVNIYKLFHGDASEEELDKIVEKYQYPVRKIAHFTEYFILGILIFLCFKEYNNKNVYLMILICFLYAVSDELHQLIVPGRDCNITDVLIDTFGSCFSILTFKKIFKLDKNK